MSGLRFSSPAKAISIASIAGLILLCAACGSSNNNSSISNAQAQAISQEFVAAVQAAMTSSFAGAAASSSSAHESLSKTIREARPETSWSCVGSLDGESCNFPVAYTGPCPSGGTIGVSGDFTVNLNSFGDGSSSDSLTLTASNCVVSNLTINGDPNIALSTTLSFTNNALDFPVTMTEKGGVSYGPHPSGSCIVNVSLTLEQTSCSVSGSVCGHSVSGSC